MEPTRWYPVAKRLYRSQTFQEASLRELVRAAALDFSCNAKFYASEHFASQASLQQQGAVPNVITHNSLISACEKGKQPERAMRILEAMQQQGVVPNVVTYSALISACEKGKQPERAVRIFEAMQQQGVLPEVIT